MKSAVQCIVVASLFSLLLVATLRFSKREDPWIVEHDNSKRRRTKTSPESSSAQNTVHVYVLAGQSNMEGHGVINSTDADGNLKNGTLLYQLKDTRTKEEFEVLWDSCSNDWRTLPDVKVWFNEAGKEMGINGSQIPGINGQDYSAGDLTVGYGTGGPPRGEFFGVELGFGFHIDVPPGDKVLIIKTAWGGKDLAQDYRPPTSTGILDPFCRLPDCNPFNVGHFYRVMLRDVKSLLQPGVLAKVYPDLQDMAIDISGFGWFQGWNDGCDLNYTAAYETNLVHLIQDLRRTWMKPQLPFVIAVSGFEGWRDNGQGRTPPDCWDGPNASKIDCECDGVDRQCRRIDIMLSQIGAANLTRHPELGCCVEAVETRDFWRPAQYSPMDQNYHFNFNAETHYLIGKAMAKSMNGLNRLSHFDDMKEHAHLEI